MRKAERQTRSFGLFVGELGLGVFAETTSSVKALPTKLWFGRSLFHALLPAMLSRSNRII